MNVYHAKKRLAILPHIRPEEGIGRNQFFAELLLDQSANNPSISLGIVHANKFRETHESIPTYRASLSENLETFRQGLALHLSRKEILIAGPYVGEFGVEIMNFQGYVRWFKRKFREIHVITFAGREALYRGCVVHTHNYDLKTAGYFYGKISNRELQEHASEFAIAHGINNFALFSPMHLRTRWHRQILFHQQQEVLAPLAPVRPNSKILFHFRHIDKAGPDKSRNIRTDLAFELCDLCRENGFELACIGHPEYSLCPAGCEDYRTEDLERTLSAIASCKLVAGELSGPIHLAVYSAKPVVTWAPGSHRIDYALKRNPFKVKMSIVRDDTTNPSPAEILCTMREALAEQSRTVT